ncbi:ABC transporter ATP-binding protein [bacterium]|nr:ABC transporter ATP-binding protein [bacterium]
MENNNIAIRVESLFKTYKIKFSITNAWSLVKIPYFFLKSLFGKRPPPTLKGLSFNVPTGAKCGFLGKNGSGKTTTIKALLNTHYPDKGDSFIFDKNVRGNYDSILKKVGSLVEKPNFYDYMTGFENLRVISIIRNIGNDKIHDVLKKVELFDDKDKSFSNYSTGMKQRLGIAASLLVDPELFMLDEPTSGLDPKGQAEVRQLIQKDYDHKDSTLFLSSHILHEVEKLCDYVVIIDDGKEITSGTVDELLMEDLETIIITTNNPEKSLEILKDMDKIKNIEINNQKQVVVKAVNGTSPRISTKLVMADIELIEMSLKKQSLEAFFLKATENEDPKQ